MFQEIEEVHQSETATETSETETEIPEVETANTKEEPKISDAENEIPRMITETPQTTTETPEAETKIHGPQAETPETTVMPSVTISIDVRVVLAVFSSIFKGVNFAVTKL